MLWDKIKANQEQGSIMFDTRKTGARIALLRREASLTQAGLAEKLGVSYQAVSNWERGESMPDIGKLLELADALDTTVDALLGREPKPAPAPTATDAPQAADRTQDAGDDRMEEAEEADEADEADEGDALHEQLDATDDLRTLIGCAPFMDEEDLDALLEQHEGDLSLAELCGFAPFLSTETLDRLAQRCSVEGNVSVLAGLAPFLSESALKALVQKSQDVMDMGALNALAPFMDSQTLSQLAHQLIIRRKKK